MRPTRPRPSLGPGDDYLLALAEGEHAMVISGDQHLLDLADRSRSAAREISSRRSKRTLAPKIRRTAARNVAGDVAALQALSRKALQKPCFSF
jgi:hypothetical protein